MLRLARVARLLLTHESGRNNRLKAPLRFFAWQFFKRVHPGPIVVPALGGQLECEPSRTTSNAVVYFGLPDWPEMRLLQRVLRPGDGFADVGANVGIYSVLAWNLVKPDGQLVAVEPDPDTAAILTRNLRLNSAPAEALVTAAAGAEAGEVQFATGADALGHVAVGAEPSRPTRVIRLDTLPMDVERLVAMKIDIEGFELEALRGATGWLERGAPRLILLETNGSGAAYGFSDEAVRSLLSQYGYVFYAVTDDGTRLTRVPAEGPFPMNSLAIRDLEWLRERTPEVQVVG